MATYVVFNFAKAQWQARMRGWVVRWAGFLGRAGQGIKLYLIKIGKGRGFGYKWFVLQSLAMAAMNTSADVQISLSRLVNCAAGFNSH